MLKKYLEKLGISSYDELTREEKDTYNEWRDALSGREITMKELKEFMEAELDLAVGRITDVDLKKEDEIFRKMEVRFIKKILTFIDSPKNVKAFAENAIKELMK